MKLDFKLDDGDALQVRFHRGKELLCTVRMTYNVEKGIEISKESQHEEQEQRQGR